MLFAKSAGMQRESQHVRLAFQQRLVFHQRQQRRDGGVGHDQRPPAIDGQGGVGFVAFQHALYRAARRCHAGVAELALLIGRGEACRQQHHIALAQWEVEVLAQHLHHLARGGGAAAFDEAEMALGDAGFQRKIELAHAAAGAPVLDEVAYARGRTGDDLLCHAQGIAAPHLHIHYLRRNHQPSRPRHDVSAKPSPSVPAGGDFSRSGVGNPCLRPSLIGEGWKTPPATHWSLR